MKKISTVIIIVLSILLILPGNSDAKGKDEEIQRDIAKKIIRFHVIANSDSKEDQELKEKVRDEILKFISPKLKESKSKEQSRKLLEQYDGEIKNIALNKIREEGYSYNVSSTFENTMFPVKQYGDLVFPEGEYEAYRIIIGSGEGKNWWCVMFPPLCFVDVTVGEVEKEKSNEMMEGYLGKKEFVYLSGKEKCDVEIRFKIVDLIKELLNK
ncbi:stage II sporulation protein R [uncultured Clostridium sp.]|uniref:stage II sporulation protein R n=1 Tax=uncultured Clostridium sp. TaxID=59620 RepID=UPI0025D2F223|nr:stage II sporulation protein R [uncultured Clostridium sp.]